MSPDFWLGEANGEHGQDIPGREENEIGIVISQARSLWSCQVTIDFDQRSYLSDSPLLTSPHSLWFPVIATCLHSLRPRGGDNFLL